MHRIIQRTCSGIHLLFEVGHFLLVVLVLTDVRFAIRGAGSSPFGFGQGGCILHFGNGIGVSLWVSRDANAKVIISKFLPDERDQIQGTRKILRRGRPLLLTVRWITPQRHNVANATIPGRLQLRSEVRPGIVTAHVGARQVKVGRVTRALGVQCQLEGQVRRTPPRTPRNVRKERFARDQHAVHALVQILKREKRKGGSVVREN